MEKDTKDLTIIKFDNEWRCFNQLSTDDIDENTMVSIINNIDTNHHWSSVQLPHILDMNKQNNYKVLNSSKWWYCKQFDSTLINKQFNQQIYLDFQPIDRFNKDFSSSNIIGTLWLNNVQIFSGPLMELNKPIELSTILLRSKNMEMNKHDNTLIIFCLDTSLSLHTRLILHGKIICATGQVQMNEKVIDKQKDSETKESDVLDYVVSVNDSTERIKVIFKSNKKYKAPLKPSISSIKSSQSDNDKKQLDENKEKLIDDLLVPRLAILILIVGTRGDVQPFIA